MSLYAWKNTTVQIQRRPANPTRNALGEPGYGNEPTYPVAYASLDVRIEYWDEKMEFTDTGERVVPTHLDMYVEPEDTILPEDRVTITTSDAGNIVGQLYIVSSVYPEWNSVGNVHHYIAELLVH